MFGKVTSGKIDSWAEKGKFSKIVKELDNNDLSDYAKEILIKGESSSVDAVFNGINSKNDTIKKKCYEILGELSQTHGNAVLTAAAKSVLYDGLSIKDSWNSASSEESMYDSRIKIVKEEIAPLKIKLTDDVADQIEYLIKPSKKFMTSSLISSATDKKMNISYTICTSSSDFKKFTTELIFAIIDLGLEHGISQKAVEKILDYSDFVFISAMMHLAEEGMLIFDLEKKIGDDFAYDEFVRNADKLKSIMEIRNEYVSKVVLKVFPSLSWTEWNTGVISYEKQSRLLEDGDVIQKWERAYHWSPKIDVAYEIYKEYISKSSISSLLKD